MEFLDEVYQWENLANAIPHLTAQVSDWAASHTPGTETAFQIQFNYLTVSERENLRPLILPGRVCWSAAPDAALVWAADGRNCMGSCASEGDLGVCSVGVNINYY